MQIADCHRINPFMPSVHKNGTPSLTANYIK